MEKLEEKFKIIFVGIPDMALVCLSNLVKQKFNIVGVVPPKKNHDTYNFFKNFVGNLGLNLIEFDKSPNEKEYLDKIKALNADIGVICSYNTKLSADFIKTTKMGYINCHPSLLPDYRGGAPYFHIINNGEKISGITLHFIDEEFDTGDIVYQEKFDVMPFETMGSIFNRTNYMISDALIEVLKKLERDKKIKRYPQPKNKDFKTAPIVDGNFRLRWNTYTNIEIERLLRACNPFYNVFTSFRGANVKVIKAEAVDLKHDFKFGKIIKADENTLLVATKGGAINITVLNIGSWGLFNNKDFYYMFTPTSDEEFV